MPGTRETLRVDNVPRQKETTAQTASASWKTNIFALTTLAGALLLFQVELILGKYILPWFGGTPSVWMTCLLFFQVLLLGGYAYAHVLATRLSPRKQSLLHGVLLGISVVLLILLAFHWPSPITPGASWRPQGGASPTGLILRFLLASIGLPFLLVSTTGPLLQHWFSKSIPGSSPYRLYALSNLGSLLSLISYPFVVEPNLRLHTQAWVWSAGYVIYVVLCLMCAPWRGPWSNATVSAPAEAQAERSQRPSWRLQSLWILLAACGSAMLLATTNVLCQQVAVVPFLWVLPLCIYLLSFIVCFENTRWYRREVFHPLFAVTAGIAFVLLTNNNATIWPQMVIYPAVLFAGCMVCHGEIALTKPVSEHLTRFYLWISAGGALGAVFVSLIAPRIFSNLWEFPLDILLVGALGLLIVRQDPRSWWQRSLVWMPLAVLAGAVMLVPALTPVLDLRSLANSPGWFSYSRCVGIAAVLILAAAGLGYASRRNKASVAGKFATRAGAVLALLILGTASWIGMRASLLDVVARSRNFYGVLAVLRWHSPLGDYLTLRDRMVDHGVQFLDPKLAREPAGYYGTNSGISLVLRNHLARPMRFGVIGLGTGTLAAFTKDGDVMRYYEINPDVIRYAHGDRAYFTYLRDCAGKVELVEGDARLSLEQEAAHGQLQQFDVLVLDAFSGDAIPIHLLTREAFQVYIKHLRSNSSILAVHVTNRSLNLSGEVAALAREFGFYLVRVYRPWLQGFSSRTDWMLLSRDPQSLNTPQLVEAGSEVRLRIGMHVWTDDFSDLLSVLR
jgi:hypothetical protein